MSDICLVRAVHPFGHAFVEVGELPQPSARTITTAGCTTSGIQPHRGKLAPTPWVYQRACTFATPVILVVLGYRDAQVDVRELNLILHDELHLGHRGVGVRVQEDPEVHE